MKGASSLSPTEILMNDLSAQSCDKCSRKIAFCEIAGLLSRGQLPSKEQLAGNPCEAFVCQNLCPSRAKASELGLESKGACPIEAQLERPGDSVSLTGRAIQGAILSSQPNFCQKF